MLQEEEDLMNLKEKVIFNRDFIADTNILFSFFWENSFTKGILLDQEFNFFSPEHALIEINSHINEIKSKTGITEEKFKELRKDLAICVNFIPLEEYKEFLNESLNLLPKHTDDIDFIALALKLNLPIWSNDHHLKEQKKIKIYTTKELLEVIEGKN